MPSTGNHTKVTHTLEVTGWKDHRNGYKRLCIRGPSHPGLLGPLWGIADADGIRVLKDAPDNLKQLIAAQLHAAWENL